MKYPVHTTPMTIAIPILEYRELLSNLKNLQDENKSLKDARPTWKQTGNLNNPDSNMRVILYSKDLGVGTGYWNDRYGWLFVDKDSNLIQTDSITHWMPFPSEP